MALSPTLSDPCDGHLILKDSNGEPLMLPEDFTPFSFSGLFEDKSASSPGSAPR